MTLPTRWSMYRHPAGVSPPYGTEMHDACSSPVGKQLSCSASRFPSSACPRARRGWSIWFAHGLKERPWRMCGSHGICHFQGSEGTGEIFNLLSSWGELQLQGLLSSSELIKSLQILMQWAHVVGKRGWWESRSLGGTSYYCFLFCSWTSFLKGCIDKVMRYFVLCCILPTFYMFCLEMAIPR